MQGRLEKKIDRLVRVIQFDVIAVSAIIAVVQFGSPDQLSPDLVTRLGAVLLVSSISLALVGLTMNANPLDWRGQTNTESAYRQRLTYVGYLLTLAYASGVTSVVMIGFGVVRLVGVKPLFDLRVGLAGLVLVVTVSVIGGWELGNRSNHDEE